MFLLPGVFGRSPYFSTHSYVMAPAKCWRESASKTLDLAVGRKLQLQFSEGRHGEGLLTPHTADLL